MDIEKQTDVKRAMAEIVNRINEDRRRIRLIEQSIDRVESSINALESSLLSQLSDLKVTIERMKKNLSEATNKVSSMETEMLRLSKVVGKSATKIELKQLESFIDLVNPVTSKFVTKDELERALEDKLEREAQV
jgi:methyl-accepting chemotaxis protein